jgi:hypothetical protein
LHTNVPGIGGADIHSPDRFLTFTNESKLGTKEHDTAGI